MAGGKEVKLKREKPSWLGLGIAKKIFFEEKFRQELWLVGGDFRIAWLVVAQPSFPPLTSANYPESEKEKGGGELKSAEKQLWLMSGGCGGGGFFSPLGSATEQLSEVADGRLVSSLPFSVFLIYLFQNMWNWELGERDRCPLFWPCNWHDGIPTQFRFSYLFVMSCKAGPEPIRTDLEVEGTWKIFSFISRKFVQLTPTHVPFSGKKEFVYLLHSCHLCHKYRPPPLRTGSGRMSCFSKKYYAPPLPSTLGAAMSSVHVH